MPYKRCGKSLCLTAADAKKQIQNKVEFYNWMQQANALFCYYEVREGKTLCQYAGASARQ